MPLTDKNKFPPNPKGVDPRDHTNPHMTKEPLFSVSIKPFMQKVQEKHLWLELLLFVLITFMGIGELLNRDFSSGWYFLLGVLTTAVLWRFIHIEDETHSHKSETVTQDAPKGD